MSTKKNIRAYLNWTDIATTMTGYRNSERWWGRADKDYLYKNERWEIYHDLANWLFVVKCNRTFNYSYWEWSTQITLTTDTEYQMSDKNVWASTMWNYWDTVTTANGWNLFQWGNNYPFEIWRTWWVSSTHIDVSEYSWQNPFSSSTYIYWDLWSSSSWYKTWMEPVNKDLWWDVTNTNIARKWPCASWFHIPTWFEWAAVMTILTYVSWINTSLDSVITDFPDPLLTYVNTFITDFHLPSCWWLDYSWRWWSWFNYWSSSWQTWAAANAYSLSRDVGYSFGAQQSSNAVWTFAIRPFKNL